MKPAVASLIISTLLGVVAGVKVAVPAPVPVGVEARDVNPVVGPVSEKRRCAPSPGCCCNKSPGDFCGNQTINQACTNGHAFHCSADGSTCDFGFELDCTLCNQLFCPGLSA
ncbi:hypothetical protein M378DRAFT_173108 [Amanita muscaria Koide BX008]|uniref:Uncharacterized protein n=1 Tax=Amanita muscaria (strain Koide BX008) TaxID=946122 RepID=A0A0C2WH57_AMAMK|nr:hypothetical protein M378DRAFT_173108 [Amanita muscaria Koide BX008]